VNIKSLPFFTIEQALNKLGRSLYPFSWPSETYLLYKKKVKGDLFNIDEEIEIVENVESEEIKRILNELDTSDAIHVDGEPIFLSMECARLATTHDSDFSFIERKHINREFQTIDPTRVHMTNLRNTLIISHVKNLLFEAACNESIRIWAEDSDDKGSHCFDSGSTSSEKIDNWNRLLLKGQCLFYSDEEDEGIVFWESCSGVHPIDLQTYINSLLTSHKPSWDLGIEKSFSFLSPKKEDSSSYDIITPFFENIEQTPKLERMPLDQALTQFFQHYAGFSLELTQIESLYAKIKTEFDPGKIASLTKPQLIDDVTKLLTYLGFKIMAQHDVKKALEEDPSLEGKILLKNDPEAIATLLFNPRKKMGGARPKKKTQETKKHQESPAS